MKRLRLLPLPALALLLGGCTTVDEGPKLPPDPGARNEIRGVLPKPAPIPQKDVPEGQSPLRRTGPDKRIDRAGGN